MQTGWLAVRFVDRLSAGDADGALRLTRGWEPAALRRLAAIVSDPAHPELARATAAQLLPSLAEEAGCPRHALCAELDRLASAVAVEASGALAARLLVARLDLTPPDELAAVLASAIARAGGRESLAAALRALPPTPSTLRARLRLGGGAAATTALASLAEAPPADLAVALAAIAAACPALEADAVAPIEALLAGLPAWSDSPDTADRDAVATSAPHAAVAAPTGPVEEARAGAALLPLGLAVAAPAGPAEEARAGAALLPLGLAEAALAFRLLARAAPAERTAEVVAMAPAALAPIAFAALRHEVRGPAIAALVAADPRCGEQLRQAAVAR